MKMWFVSTNGLYVQGLGLICSRGPLKLWFVLYQILVPVDQGVPQVGHCTPSGGTGGTILLEARW